MKIGELFVELGFKVDETKVKDFIKSMGDLNLNSVLATIGLGGAYEAIKKIMDVAEQSAMGITAFGKETGLSTIKMQQFAQFAEQMGASSEDAVSSIKALQMNMAKVAIGEGNVRPFTLTGISPYQSPWSALNEIRKKILDPAIPDAYKRMIAQEFNLSESMLMVMKSSDAEWASIDKQMYATQEQTEALMKYHAVWVRVGQAIKQAGTDLAAQWGPQLSALGDFIGKIFGWLHDLGPYLKPLIEIVATIAAIIFPAARVVTLIYMIATNFKTIEDSVSHIYDMFKGMYSVEGLKKLTDPFGLSDKFASLAPAIGGARGGDKSVTMTNHFNITGQNAEDIAHKVDQMMRKHYSDAEYQVGTETQ